eukprot:ANDGO_02574.mRNA.1 E3 ubiquitin-protein ligase CHIP
MSGSRAEQLKEQGNAAFSRGEFQEAIQRYSQAIQHYANAVYFTNRANCYLRLDRVELAKGDCYRAIEVNPHWGKSYYYLGKIALEYEKDVSSAVRMFSKAFERARSDPNSAPSYLLDLHRALYSAKKLDWETQNSLTMAKRLELLRFFEQMADRDRVHCAGRRWHEDRGGNDCASEMNAVSDRERSSYLEELADLVLATAEPKAPFSVEPLQCGILLDFMVDPVVTPSGQSYERIAIVDHLKNNPWDPITRQPLTEKDLVPNTALKELTHLYLESFPYTFDQ